MPQKVKVDFITIDGLYSTDSILKEIKQDKEFVYFLIDNPASLDYQQNRVHYRIVSEIDCIYTVDTDVGVESYNTVTYDISAGGVSIIMDKLAISKEEMYIVIFLPGRDIKTHLKFIRCESFEGTKYKISFEYTDLSDSDYEMLSDLCVSKQLLNY